MKKGRGVGERETWGEGEGGREEGEKREENRKEDKRTDIDKKKKQIVQNENIQKRTKEDDEEHKT